MGAWQGHQQACTCTLVPCRGCSRCVMHATSPPVAAVLPRACSVADVDGSGGGGARRPSNATIGQLFVVLTPLRWHRRSRGVSGSIGASAAPSQLSPRQSVRCSIRPASLGGCVVWLCDQHLVPAWQIRGRVCMIWQLLMFLGGTAAALQWGACGAACPSQASLCLILQLFNAL